MGNCFSCDDEHKQPELEGQHEGEGKQQEKPEVQQNGKSSPAAPGTPALREEPCACARKKADDGEAANPEGVEPKVMSDEEAEQEEERIAKEQRKAKKDKETVDGVTSNVDHATHHALLDYMPSTGDSGADIAIHGAVRSAAGGVTSLGAGAAVNAKSGRQQEVDGKEVGQEAGITAARTAGDTIGGVAGDQARENMPETGNPHVDWAMQNGADLALRKAGGLLGEKGAQKSAQAAEEKELESLKEKNPEEFERRKKEMDEREEKENEVMKEKAKGTADRVAGGLFRSVFS